jgi:hypothetical protein
VITELREEARKLRGDAVKLRDVRGMEAGEREVEAARLEVLTVYLGQVETITA